MLNGLLQKKTGHPLLRRSNLLWPSPLEFQAILWLYPSGIPNFYRFSIITPMEFRLFLTDFCLPLRNSKAFLTLPLWNGNGPPQQGVHGFFLEKPNIHRLSLSTICFSVSIYAIFQIDLFKCSIILTSYNCYSLHIIV